VYRSALRGYAIDLAPDQAAEVAATSGVTAVEPSHTLQLAAATTAPRPYEFCQFLPRGVDRVDGDTSSANSSDGRGSTAVNVAVIDSGVWTSHPDLNVVGGTDCTLRGSSYDDGGWPDFPDGHGTMVGGKREMTPRPWWASLRAPGCTRSRWRPISAT
jgi:subtilisin family serine protease